MEDARAYRRRRELELEDRGWLVEVAYTNLGLVVGDVHAHCDSDVVSCIPREWWLRLREAFFAIASDQPVPSGLDEALQRLGFTPHWSCGPAPTRKQAGYVITEIDDLVWAIDKLVEHKASQASQASGRS